jgi:methyltransferase
MVTLSLYALFLALLALERMVELFLSRRNANWALQQGGIETGQGHFRWMKLLHTVFFVACLVEVYLAGRPFLPWLGYPMFAVALLAQGLRYWAISSLGRYWNVRVIVVPDAPAITRGPYRFLRHPNYLAVVLEGLAVPLIHSAWLTALLFTLLNAWLLAVRIRCEEETLARYCSYQDGFQGKRRFLPRLSPQKTTLSPQALPE